MVVLFDDFYVVFVIIVNMCERFSDVFGRLALVRFCLVLDICN